MVRRRTSRVMIVLVWAKAGLVSNQIRRWRQRELERHVYRPIEIGATKSVFGLLLSLYTNRTY